MMASEACEEHIMDSCLLSQETTFLEACIENHTKSNLHMDQVEFEPAHNWSATMLKADGLYSANSSQTRCVIDVLS